MKESSMTDKQINAAIARECGWKDVWRCQGVSESASFVGTSPDNQFLPVPNYCGDLNAMHEAEKVLQNQFTPMIEEAYWRNLQWVKPHPIYATARQRAEAFLKTIGKWEE